MRKEHLPVYVESKRLVYLRVPKCASSSISQSLKKVGKLCKTETKYAILDDDNIFKFSFVRNPYSRVVSAFIDRLPTWIEQSRAGRIDWLKLSKFKDLEFEEFVEQICAIPDQKADMHFKSQYNFVYNGKVYMPKFTGKVETINNDWKRLREKCGIDLPELMHVRKSKRNPIKSYYNDHTRKLVAERYARDFEEFEYSWENLGDG